MQALKIVTIAMGVLIVVATTVLIVTIFKRAAAPAPPPAKFAAVLDEPAGTRIAGIAAVQDRLAVQLQGGGADRVVLVDPRNGAVAGRISLSH